MNGVRRRCPRPSPTAGGRAVRRVASTVAVGAMLCTAGSALAQGTGGIIPPVPDGAFRGTLASRSAAGEGTPTSVSGSARWRLELDSIDWRYKLTVRVALQRPAPVLLVVRTADTLPPPATLRVETRDPRSLPQGREHGSASLVVREAGGSRWYERWPGDTVTFDTPTSLARSAVLHGRLRLRGFRADEPANPEARIVAGDFAATFDPRPDPRPRTMSDSLQEAILRRALWDAGLAWQDASIHLHPNDSTGSPALLRGYLQSRWSDAAIIESVSTTYQHVSMRMRGRYAPVTCSFVDGTVSCENQRSWWDRLRGRIGG